MKPILILLFGITLLSLSNSIFAEVQQNTTEIESEPVVTNDFVFVPRHYDIETRVILSKDGDPVGKPGTAPGKLVIFGKPRSPTQILKFEASKQVVIDPVSITVKNVSVTSVCMIRDKWGNPSFQVKLGRVVNPNEELEVRFEYVTKIIGAVSIGSWADFGVAVLEVGLVIQHYNDENNKKIKYAVTMMGNNNAHNVFPTSDQNAEVTYKLRVIRQANYTTVANAELENSSEDPNHKGWVIDTFALSNKSKIEGAFFAVSDLVFAESRVANTTARIRVHAPPHLVRHCRESQAFVDAAAKAIVFYSDYFNQSVPSLDIFPSFSSTDYIPPRILLDRLDVVSDSFFAEPCYESNKTYSTPGALVYLVSEIWIKQTYNEGLQKELRTFLQEVGRKALVPNYDDRDVLSSIFQREFDKWLKAWSNPDHNGEEIFEGEPKGFGVALRMLEAVLGQSGFRRGFQLYFQSSNKNLTGFCEAMDQPNKFPPHVDMCGLLKNYASEKRPVVKISALNTTHVEFRLRQLENATIRNVPIFTLTEKGTRNHVWLTEQHPKVELLHDTRKWIVAEANSSLHYRTLYDDKLFELIRTQMRRNHTKFDWLTRATLFSDYFGVIRKGNTSDKDIVKIFSLITYLDEETDSSVWSVIYSYLEELEILLGSHQNFAVYKNFMITKLEALWSARKIGTKEEHDDYKFSNSKLIKWACSLGSRVCYALAKKFLEAWKLDPENPLSALDFVLCPIGASGGRPVFDYFWERFENKLRNSSDSSSLQYILTPLSCATETYIIDEMLEKVVEKAEKNETGFHVVSILLEYTARNPAASERLLQFLSKNLDRLAKGIGQPYGNGWIWHVPSELGRRLSSPEQLQQMRAFVEELGEKFELHESQNSKAQLALRNMERGVAWMKTTGEQIINTMKLDNF